MNRSARFGGSFAVRYPQVSGAMVDDKMACILRSGADALVSTLGMADITVPATDLSDGLHALLAAMADAGVRRVIAVASTVALPHPDGGLRGELRYLAGHYLRGQSCSLCEITHSPFRRKSAWDAAAADLGIPIDLLHLNELDPGLAAHVGDDAAMVVGERPGMRVTLLDNADLSRLDGDVSSFFSLLRLRLSAT